MAFFYLLIPLGAAAGIYLIRKVIEYRWGWVRSNFSLKDKIFIITGANTGLGYETTRALVKRGAIVVLACRSEERAQKAIKKISSETQTGSMHFLNLDLASFDSIRMFTREIKSKFPNFDTLICNAGLAVKTPEYTKENYELHFGTNHLGHFLLVDLLKDNIRKINSRIVVVSSQLHTKGLIDFEKLGKFTESSGRSNALYSNSKLCNFYFARELYKRGYDVRVLCPGLCHTDFFRAYNPKWYHYVLFSPIIFLFLRSAEQGAQNIIHCATVDNVNTDKVNPFTGYYVRNLKQTKSSVNFTEEISEKLWNVSAEMCQPQ